MIDQSYAKRLAGFGEWTPGAREIERFREDLYLRIIGTAEAMNRILDEQAETVLLNLRKAAADGKLDEERTEFEMGAVSDAVEHSRFTFNWAHVMLTTRVLDAIKTWSSDLTHLAPTCQYAGASEFLRLRSEFACRFKIDFSRCPAGDSFLEGMALARNKIVHNGALAWETSTHPDDIFPVGTEWSPCARDQDFKGRFPEYVDTLDRITVTSTLFNTNVEQAVAFITWVGERIDLFVRLLEQRPAGSCPS